MLTNFDVRKNMKPSALLPIDNINKPKEAILDQHLYCESCGLKISPTGECGCSD